MIFEQPVWNFEQAGGDAEGDDETSVNLRAYLDRISDEKFLAYDSSWSDEQVVAWDGNFKDDGTLLLPCSERDVDVAEFRRVLEEAAAYRARVRNQ